MPLLYLLDPSQGSSDQTETRHCDREGSKREAILSMCLRLSLCYSAKAGEIAASCRTPFAVLAMTNSISIPFLVLSVRPHTTEASIG